MRSPGAALNSRCTVIFSCARQRPAEETTTCSAPPKPGPPEADGTSGWNISCDGSKVESHAIPISTPLLSQVFLLDIDDARGQAAVIAANELRRGGDRPRGAGMDRVGDLL